MTNPTKSGYFFVHKNPGLTSSDVVIRLKKKFHLDSIGHTGTLDRFAEGLLILPFGDYPAFSQLFLGEDKTYYAEVTLGKRTDSGDLDGRVEEEFSQSELTRRQAELRWSEHFLQSELAKILDWRVQKAPKLSALKVNGKRQSDHVRSGREVIEKERPIRIERVWDIAPTETGFSFRIHVSSGTYIRKIAMDLSGKWGIPMALTRLVRESIGAWSLGSAKSYDELELKDAKSWQEVLVLPARRLTPEERKVVIHGGYLWDKLPEAGEKGFYLLDGETDAIVAWCHYQGKPEHLPYRYGKVFFNPSSKIMFSI
jgi:tRNA pseudouridine55 synthase